MTLYQHAQRHAAQAFHVFPLIEQQKLPLIEDFPNRASRDEVTLAQWWNADMGAAFTQTYNVGISTSRYGDDPAVSLCVIDVDNKNEKRGSESVLMLEFEGIEFPATYTQDTPTGGQHLVYWTRTPVRNLVDRDGKGSIGRGLDIRGVGGFIVGSGSVTEKGAYTDNGLPVVEAPAALIERILQSGGAPIERSASTEMPEGLDAERVIERAIDYLRHAAPESIKGNGGDATAYKVAAHLKDLGVPEADALDLLMDHWFDGSGWSPERLEVKIANAYRYGKQAPGASAPESQFTPVAVQNPTAEGEAPEDPNGEHPVNRLNQEFAFVLIGGNHAILWETSDAEDRAEVRLLSEDAFHKMHSGATFPVRKTKKGKKGERDSESTEYVSITKMWMDSPGRDTPPPADKSPFWRRSYKGIWFMPEQPCPPGWYNAWRGFSCEPLPKGETPKEGWVWALDAWKAHLLNNICNGSEPLARWLTGWLAHMIQKPWEKPLVAVVFKGQKGTGKNSVIERVAALLGPHAMVTHERRYITSQFNGHMESLVLLVLDEALWAGDKEGEGKLKGLITGARHAIERKGKEIYHVRNLLRLAVIGNEDWLVPASHDERRWAAFEVGLGNVKDKPFFERMRKEMEAGGYSLLLRYLLDYDLTGIDINEAPVTAALLDQKLESLDPAAHWWFECLQQGQFVGGDFSGNWPEEVPVETMQAAVRRHFQNHNVRIRVPSATSIGRLLNKCCPSVKHGRKGRDVNGKQPYVYRLPPMEMAREQWSEYIGQDVEWSSAE